MVKTEEEKALKREYLARKKKMIEFEKDNYSKIVFFEALDGFYIAGNHSAIIMYNLIAPELGLKISVYPDRDFERRFFGGILRIKNLEKYKELLTPSQYIKDCKQTARSLVFNLVKPLTPEEYKLLEHSEDIKRDQLVNSVSTTKALPRTYQSLRTLVKEAYKSSEKKSDAVSRELLTGRIVEEARRALILFLDACKKTQGFDLAMDKLDELLVFILKDLIVIEAAGVWNMAQVRRISFPAISARTNLAIERKQFHS